MRILFLHKQILFPRDTGGKIRVLNLLKHLARWHRITYVCNLRPGEGKYLRDMEQLGLQVEAVPGQTSTHGGARFLAAAAINLLSPRPYAVDRNYDPAIRERVAQLLLREDYDLVICDTVQMARHLSGLDLPPVVLFQHNVEAKILERHAQVSHGLRKLYMQDQYRKMKSFERGCGERFDHVIAVSEQDKQTFREDYGWTNVDAIDTAVDTDFFQPQPWKERPGRVMFLGSMDWLPNQDGIKFFVDRVWPLVLAQHPEALFQIVGRNPPPDIRALSERQGISVTGSVPDVRPYLAEASVVVVPLLVGGGTRLKIYEAMAMARATVSTTIGAEGLPVVPGTHFLEANTPEEFADAVAGLIGDEAARRRIGQAADGFVRQHYGCEPIARQFEKICLETIARRKTAKPPLDSVVTMKSIGT